MTPYTLLVEDPFSLRLLVIQWNLVLWVVPVSLGSIGAIGNIFLAWTMLFYPCEYVLIVRPTPARCDWHVFMRQDDQGEASQQGGSEDSDEFHSCPPGAAVADKLMPLDACRSVIKYAVSSFLSSTVNDWRGSIAPGTSACGLSSHASIQAGVSQLPALFKLGPTYPPEE